MLKTPIGNRPGFLPLQQVSNADGLSCEADVSTELSPDMHTTTARSRGILLSEPQQHRQHGGAPGSPTLQVVPQPQPSAGCERGMRASPYARHEKTPVRTGDSEIVSAQEVSASQRMVEGRTRRFLLQFLRTRAASSSALGTAGGQGGTPPLRVASLPARGAVSPQAQTQTARQMPLTTAMPGLQPLHVYHGLQFSGAPPVSLQGLIVRGGQNVLLSSMLCHGHQQPWPTAMAGGSPVLSDSVPPPVTLHESLPVTLAVPCEPAGPENTEVSSQEHARAPHLAEADISSPVHAQLLETTRIILKENPVGDCMATRLPYVQQVRVAAHMRKALGREYRAFCDIHARYSRATASSCSLEAFYFSLQNMCDAARRAPELRTNYVRMIDSDRLIRRYWVALPRAVPLIVVAQVVTDDLFGAMSVVEQLGQQEQPDDQALSSASEVVQQRGLRWRMQCTMGYDYMGRVKAVCDAYWRDSGIRLSHEQLYMGLMSLCHEAGESTGEPCIERLSADVLRTFTQAIQVQGVNQGKPLDGIKRYFVQLPDDKRFVLLASPQGSDPLGLIDILYKPGWPQIRDACKRMAETPAIWNVNWR